MRLLLLFVFHILILPIYISRFHKTQRNVRLIFLTAKPRCLTSRKWNSYGFIRFNSNKKIVHTEGFTIFIFTRINQYLRVILIYNTELLVGYRELQRLLGLAVFVLGFLAGN